MNALSKYFTTVFFICYLLVVFVWPSIRTYRQTKITPLTFGTSDNAHDFIGRSFKVLLIAILLTIGTYWINGNFYQYLLPATFLANPVIQWSGMVLCSLSLIWTTVAQWQMGTSWRIGIDENHPTELRTAGLFALSRNPIFLGLLTTLFGFFLLLPNALTLVYLVAGYLLIQIQIRLEEEFLLKQHGASYIHYKASVRRLL
jgi:protein-S-isoprenylcysteine O-methyltransferase Ste14